jgi:hypothetical protein
LLPIVGCHPSDFFHWIHNKSGIEKLKSINKRDTKFSFYKIN